MYNKGDVINCESCGESLYEFNRDVLGSDRLRDAPEYLTAIPPQEELLGTSRVTQECHKCGMEFNLFGRLKVI